MAEQLPSEPRPRRSKARIWLAIAAVAAGLTAIVVLLPGGDTDPLATPTTLTTSSTSESSEPAGPTTTTLGYEAFTISGAGNDIVDLSAPGDLATVLHITHDGQSGFTVRTIDDNSEPIETLVDTEGAYDGSRAVNLILGDVISGLEIVADGTWTVTATYLGDLERRSGEAEGTGDDVLLMDVSNPEMVIVYNSESDFSVFMWAFETQRYLVNQPGPLELTVSVPVGGLVIEVTAEGDWSLSTTGS